MNDLELRNLLAKKKLEIESRGTISQEDVLSLESIAGSNFITGQYNINNFCSIRDSFNLNLVTESLSSLLNSNGTLDYSSSLKRRISSVLTFLDTFTKKSYYAQNTNVLEGIIRDYNGKCYNNENILVPIKSLTFSEFIDKVMLYSHLIGGSNYQYSSFYVTVNEKKCDIPYETFKTYINSSEFKEEVLKHFRYDNSEEAYRRKSVTELSNCIYNFTSKTFSPSTYALEKTIISIFMAYDENSNNKIDIAKNLFENEDDFNNIMENDGIIGNLNRINTFSKFIYTLHSKSDVVSTIVQVLRRLKSNIERGEVNSESYIPYGFKESLYYILSKGEDSDYDPKLSIYSIFNLMMNAISNIMIYPEYSDEIRSLNGIKLGETRSSDND